MNLSHSKFMHVKRSPRVFWLIATLNLSPKMVYIPKIRRNIDMLGCVPLRFTTPTIALVLVLVFFGATLQNNNRFQCTAQNTMAASREFRKRRSYTPYQVYLIIGCDRQTHGMAGEVVRSFLV